MADDLYGVLGVERSAGPDEIKRAYRKAAKSAHPDAPEGSAEKFARVSKALAVLTDPTRRDQYDRTGNADSPEPDTTQARGMQMAFQTIMNVLGALETKEIDPATQDVIALAVLGAKDQLAELRQRREKHEQDIAHVRKMAKRFKAKKGKTSRLTAMFEGRARDLENTVHHIRRDEEAWKVALSVLQDHTFEKDAPPPAPMHIPAFFLENMLGGLGG